MILIDNRVGAKELYPKIKSARKLTRLEYADVCFQGNGPNGPVTIGIERKRFRDLIDSITSGRLSGHQLIGLTNSYDYVYLLCEGLFKIGNDGYLRRPKGKSWVVVQFGNNPLQAAYLFNYLNTLAIFANIIIQFTLGIRISGIWIDSLYRWWSKPWKGHTSHLKFYHEQPPPRVFFRPPGLLVRMVKEIDGVGWDKAKAIGRRYSSIMSLMCTDEKNLMEIKGIGKKLASKILMSLRGEIK